MGFRKHLTLKCHTCKRRQAVGGSKHGASRLDGAKRSGWVLRRLSEGHWVWHCPACARKVGD